MHGFLSFLVHRSVHRCIYTAVSSSRDSPTVNLFNFTHETPDPETGVPMKPVQLKH